MVLRGPRARRGVDPVIAVIVIVALALALAIAVAAWLTGLSTGLGRVEVYYSGTMTVGPRDYAMIPLRDYARIEAWTVDEGGYYTLYVRVAAVKNLDYLKVEVEVRTPQGYPRLAAYPVAYWEENDVPAGWYSERYWTPLEPDELPVTIIVEAWLAEGRNP